MACFLFLSVASIFAQQSDNKDTKNEKKKQNSYYLFNQKGDSILIQEGSSANSHGNSGFGFGLGYDYGGFGANLTVYPERHLGLFGGFGYALIGAGYNAGIKLRLTGKDDFWSVTPYLLAMYGYYAVVQVTNASDYNKMFYGPTVGFGFDFKSITGETGYFSMDILFPLRDNEVSDYINKLKIFGVEFKNEMLPVGISLGYHFFLAD